MYSSGLLTLLFLLLLYSRSRTDEEEEPKESENASDNEELTENKGNEESSEDSDDEEDDESKNGEGAGDIGNVKHNEELLRQFHEEQLQAGHVASQKEHCNEIGRVVRKTIFPEIKFANNEKFFDYQPVRDEKDGSVGMLFRRIRSKVATVGADEETWWIGMKKAVKDALQKKRGTVCQAIKLALLGKLTHVLSGLYEHVMYRSSHPFCLFYCFYNEIKLSGRETKQQYQAWRICSR